MNRRSPSPAPRRGDSSAPPRLPLAGLLAVAAILTIGGCGGASRPEPVEVEPPPRAPDTVSRTSGLDSVQLREVPPPEPRKAWLPPAVRWRPTTLAEGDVVGVHLHQPPAGRRPEAVEGELDGRQIRFVRHDDGWFGVGSAPIGEAGPATLVLRFRLDPDSTVVQRVDLHIEERTFPATRLSVDPRYSSPSREALVRIREERKLVDAVLARVTDRWLPLGSFRRPRGTRVTSPYGQRRIFNDELRSRHTGVDLAGEKGAPVRAAARGEVALTGELYFAGNAVYLDHGLGLYTGYFHLSEIEVAEGDTIRAGEVLGRVGSTGRVTGPHLHWSAYVNGQPLDAGSLLDLGPPGEGADSPSPDDP